MAFIKNIGFASIALCGACLSGQGLDLKAVQECKTNPNGVVLHVSGKGERAEITKALDDRRLVGYSPLVIGFEPKPDDLAWAGRDLSWQQNDVWALYCMGQKIASGSKLPTVDELQNTFASANISNRVVLLRNFLAQNPANLNARAGLMGELHRHADQKTARKFNVASRSPMEIAFSSQGSTIVPDIKDELSQEDDQNIWGELAEQLNIVFATDDWLSVLPEHFHRGISRYAENMALYSPSMKGIYKKNLPQVEEAVKARQIDLALWKMWQAMAQASKRRLLDFYPQFNDLPDGSNLAWPPVNTIEWMQQEARLANDWQKIIDFNWPWWRGTQFGLDSYAPVGRMPVPDSDLLAINRERTWKKDIFPLLEACLNAKDYDKANEIYFDISSRPALGSETKQAIEMAKGLKYTFPMPPTSTNRPKVQSESFMGNPIAGNQMIVRTQANKLKDICWKGHLNLLVVDPSIDQAQHELSKNDLEKKYAEILSEGKVPEYYVFPYVWEPSNTLAVELTEQEGFSRNTFIWGILDDNAKYHHGGYTPPTSDDVLELLVSVRRKTRTDTFREFAKNNPDSVTAKVLLVTELGRLGNARTHNAKLDAKGLLDESEDQEIWGEYVNIANSLIPQLAVYASFGEIMFCFERPFQPQEQNMTSKGVLSPIIKNSRLLQRLANRNIELIENAMQSRPHSRELWTLWGIFAPHVPNRSLTSLRAMLTPVPGLQGCPPPSLYPDLINHYKSLEAWGRLIDLVEPIWDVYQKRIEAGDDIKHWLTQDLWGVWVVPLCQAHEKIGQDAKAEKIRADWKKGGGWQK
jgi:hypothetical protein